MPLPIGIIVDLYNKLQILFSAIIIPTIFSFFLISLVIWLCIVLLKLKKQGRSVDLTSYPESDSRDAVNTQSNETMIVPKIVVTNCHPVSDSSETVSPQRDEITVAPQKVMKNCHPASYSSETVNPRQNEMTVAPKIVVTNCHSASDSSETVNPQPNETSVVTKKIVTNCHRQRAPSLGQLPPSYRKAVDIPPWIKTGVSEEAIYPIRGSDERH